MEEGLLFDESSAKELRRKYLSWMLTLLLARPSGDRLREREFPRFLERMAKNERRRER